MSAVSKAQLAVIQLGLKAAESTTTSRALQSSPFDIYSSWPAQLFIHLTVRCRAYHALHGAGDCRKGCRCQYSSKYILYKGPRGDGVRGIPRRRCQPTTCAVSSVSGPETAPPGCTNVFVPRETVSGITTEYRVVYKPWRYQTALTLQLAQAGRLCTSSGVQNSSACVAVFLGSCMLSQSLWN